MLHIKPGETSDDGLFTLDALRCIGACGIAPAVTINGTVYPKMTVDGVPQIIEVTERRRLNPMIKNFQELEKISSKCSKCLDAKFTGADGKDT